MTRMYASRLLPLLWMSLVFRIFCVEGHAAAGGGFVYALTEGGESVAIIGYSGPGGVVEVPPELDGLPVTEIGFLAFHFQRAITRVVIPEPVARIGAGAFEGCSNLVSIELPETLTEIGGSAFAFCEALEEIVLPEGILHLRENTFLGCQSLLRVRLPTSLLTIGEGAFEFCVSLEFITLPPGLMGIGSHTFADTLALASVTLLGDAPELGNAVFAGAGIDSPIGGVRIYRYAGRSGFESPQWAALDPQMLRVPGLIPYPYSKDILRRKARLGGEVVNSGASPVTERGVIFAVASVNGNPLPGGAGVIALTAVSGMGAFLVEVDGLLPDTVYSFRAWAANADGIAFSEVVTFATATAFAFENWMSRHNLPPGSDLTKTGDADGSGLANLLKFAFGMAPQAALSTPLRHEDGILLTPGRPVLNLGSSLDFARPRAVFGRRRDFRVAGLRYAVQFSADLRNWQTSQAEPVVVAVGEEIEAVALPFPFFVATSRGLEKPSFFRVLVTEEP
jgi:hypothetical protein